MYSVGSFLELVTAAAAWRIYDTLWRLLIDTGLAYLPFAAILIGGLRSATVGIPLAQRGVAALQVSELRLYLAFLVVFLGVVPSVTVHPKDFVFAENDCLLSDSDMRRRLTLRHAAESSDYDFLELGGEPVSVPLWWWLLNNLSRGLTAAAINALPCRLDLRTLSADIVAASVRDPRLREELLHFQRACWKVAYRRFLRVGTASSEPLPEGSSLEEDLSWAGSSFFLQSPGYYDQLFPAEAVSSFPYDSERDDTFAAAEFSADGGFPSCRQWWLDSDLGLRARLLTSLDHGLRARWRHLFRSRSDAEDDRLLRAVLHTDRPLAQGVLKGELVRTGWAASIADSALSIGAGFGAVRSAPELAVSLKLVRDTAPIIQSLLLLLLVATLPILLAVGLFQLELLISLSLAFSSIVFWSFLFRLVFWLDTALTAAILPDSAFGLLDNGFFQLVFQVLLFSLYVAFPPLFTWFLAAAGSSFATALAHGIGGGVVAAQRLVSVGAGATPAGKRSTDRVAN